MSQEGLIQRINKLEKDNLILKNALMYLIQTCDFGEIKRSSCRYDSFMQDSYNTLENEATKILKEV